jgi:protein-S-isoprenylcysteine O-methyltransferase Ste14
MNRAPMSLRAALVTFLPLLVLPYLLYANAPPPGRWGPFEAVGLALVLLGVALLTFARWQLGRAFSVLPQATVLVTGGLYRRIRNPVYVFGLVAFAGLILYVGRPWLLLFLVPLAAAQFVRAGRESKVLEEQFGDAYREYRAHTWF